MNLKGQHNIEGEMLDKGTNIKVLKKGHFSQVVLELDILIPPKEK